MSIKAHFQTQFAYHGATYNRLLDCAERLDHGRYQEQPGYGLGSIHDILFHILYWQNRWRQSLENSSRSVYLKPDDFEDLPSLRSGIAREQVAWQRVFEGLSEAAFDEQQSIGGSQLYRWRIFQHLVLHGMQHHSEVAALLTSYGESPGGIDFIWFTG